MLMTSRSCLDALLPRVVRVVQVDFVTRELHENLLRDIAGVVAVADEQQCRKDIVQELRKTDSPADALLQATSVPMEREASNHDLTRLFDSPTKTCSAGAV